MSWDLIIPKVESIYTSFSCSTFFRHICFSLEYQHRCFEVFCFFMFPPFHLSTSYLPLFIIIIILCVCVCVEYSSVSSVWHAFTILHAIICLWDWRVKVYAWGKLFFPFVINDASRCNQMWTNKYFVVVSFSVPWLVTKVSRLLVS